MQEIDKLGINLSLNEIKRSIAYLHDKLETISNKQPSIDISSFKEDIIKELQNIKKEIDKKPKSSSNELSSIQYSINNIQETLINKIYPVISIKSPNVDLSYMFNDINKTLTTITKKVSEIETKSLSDSVTIDNMNTQINNVSTSFNDYFKDTSGTSILISYPTAGTATITSGDTTFDFRKGIVTYANGTKYNMSGSSEINKEIYIKSFTVFVDRPIDISISGKTLYTTSIPSGTFRLKNIEVSRIKVHTSGDTNIWICGSTLTDGAPNISFSFSTSDSIGMPNTLIVGSKTDISTIATQITTTSTPINKVVTIKVRSLGGGTYIAIGDSSSQPYRLTAIGISHDIDTIDNLNKVYIITDGTNASIEWFGG